MKFVEPIRKRSDIKKVRDLLLSRDNIRDLLFFSLGINVALRISDLLGVQVKDLFDERGNIRDWFDTKETKTNKRSRINITPKVKADIEKYKAKHPKIVESLDNYMFFNSRLMPIGSKAITRKQGWKIINDVCHRVGLKGSFGGHTLRKTWGYMAKLQGVELYLIQQKLNHSNTGVTRRYLGITDDDMRRVAEELDL